MEIEDGVIWVYGVGKDGVQAFTERAPLKAASAIARPTPSCILLSKNGSSRSCGLDAAGSYTITAEREEHDPTMADQNPTKASLGT
jgi:hypothetical protein